MGERLRIDAESLHALVCIMRVSEGLPKVSAPLALSEKEGRAYARYCMRFQKGSGGAF